MKIRACVVVNIFIVLVNEKLAKNTTMDPVFYIHIYVYQTKKAITYIDLLSYACLSE